MELVGRSGREDVVVVVVDERDGEVHSSLSCDLHPAEGFRWMRWTTAPESLQMLCLVKLDVFTSCLKRRIKASLRRSDLERHVNRIQDGFPNGGLCLTPQGDL